MGMKGHGKLWRGSQIKRVQVPGLPGTSCTSLDSSHNPPRLSFLHHKIATPALLPISVLSPHSCLTLCDRMDSNPPGSSVHGILQARILEWVAFPFSRGSSPPRDRTQVSRIVGGFFISWATREAPTPSLADYCKNSTRLSQERIQQNCKEL